MNRVTTPPLLERRLAILAGCLCAVPRVWGQDAANDGHPLMTELPAVTVTTRKREEPIQTVPISVTAVDGKEAATTIAPSNGNAGLARVVPNLSFTDSGGQFANLFTIRGVGSFAPLSPDDTSVVIYLDEIPRSVYGAQPTLLDVDRVEVMRGPQGTLFGRNTQGGAINVITHAPRFRREFSATAQAGTQGHRLGEMIANAPLSDTLAGRLAVRYSNLDGTVPNILSGSSQGRIQVGAARGSLLWAPGGRTSVTLTGFHDRRESDAPRFIWQQNPSFPQSAVNPSGNIRWQDTGGSLKVEHDFDTVRLTSMTSYQESRSFQPFDLTDGLIYSALTGRPQALFNLAYADYSDIHFKEKTAQQELRLSSQDGGRLAWTAGFNIFRSRFANDSWAIASPAAFNFAMLNGTQANRIDTDSAAAFGEGTLALTDRLKVSLGLRYTHERKDGDYAFVGNGTSKVVPSSRQSLHLTDSFWTGRTGLSYEWTPDVMTYATVSRGAVAAGYPVVSVNSPLGRADPPYPTSKSRTYELGFKSMWLNRNLGINGSVFYNDVKNGHVIVFDPSALLFTAAALNYTSKGMELEAAAQMTPRLKFTAGVGYTHAELNDVPAASKSGARSGNRVPNTPRLSASAGVQYEAPARIGSTDGRATVSLAWQHVGKRAADVRESFDLPGYGVVSTRLGWQHAQWEIYAFAWNLFDKKYVVTGQAWSPTTRSVRVGPPRVVGIGMKLRF
ncbi:TonB-dependent receptor [Verminephrobacter aporrectodeae subsp. tuberculatae]|uniref:TonB-dependent receptor n=1 Tax=Verminephrobacter aporrectodeae subsp. tuberculatae TaxID=1110392 RepID=A0ABT3KSE9_9BURK|nr:TonB-dependent receptor [Verminephrobacter aporrectodeae]MCW5321221.1 TonB-dependent receptor [Verminephrobacter aporrectodeae subsp. tuberculatae]